MKYFSFFLFFIVQITVFADTFKLISRKGEVSVIVTEDNADIDFRKSFPEDYFSITTKEYSYLVIDNGRDALILMPSSKLTYEDGKFTLHDGYMYVKSKHNDEVEMKFAKDDKSYLISGKSFAVISYNDDISIITYNTLAKIMPENSWGASYYLEPYRKSTIIPSLLGPFNATENEKTLIETVARQLEAEVNSHLNKDIERYSFKILEGTKNETTIYRVVHPEPGPNVFLIAPHGSERVGTDVAIERINMPIKKGSMTIVPIAVPEAYAHNLRAIEGQDINNRFFDNKKKITTDTDKLAQKYMDMLEKRYGSKAIGIKFKNKKWGWHNFSMRVDFENGEQYCEDRWHDLFFIGYLQCGNFSRPSCYECQFKGFPHKSDITLADFWGIEKIDLSMDQDRGTSLVMVNSDKGMELFNAAKNQLVWKEFTMESPKKKKL